MKGPSENGELCAVLECMKGGQVVTHPCAGAQTSPYTTGIGIFKGIFKW